MNNLLTTMKNEELIRSTKLIVQEERRIQVKLLLHLKEIESRRLFLDLGYSSLFNFVTKELGYSESSGYRRIQAMRLMKSVPEIEQKIGNGSFSLTAAAQVQTFIKQEEKKNGLVSKFATEELIAAVENKSAREVEKHLLSLKPAETLTGEKIRQVTETHTEIKLVVPEELKQKLDKLKFLLSHVNHEMSYQDLFSYLADKAITQLDPANKIGKGEKKLLKSQTGKKQSLSAPEVTKNKIIKNEIDNGELHKRELIEREINKSEANDSEINNSEVNISEKKNSEMSLSGQRNIEKRTRYISAQLRSTIWKRDNGCCSFISPVTGKSCGSKYQLQLDHIHPFALGGKTDVVNLRLLCGQHNRCQARKIFGTKF